MQKYQKQYQYYDICTKKEGKKAFRIILFDQHANRNCHAA